MDPTFEIIAGWFLWEADSWVWGLCARSAFSRTRGKEETRTGQREKLNHDTVITKTSTQLILWGALEQEWLYGDAQIGTKTLSLWRFSLIDNHWTWAVLSKGVWLWARWPSSAKGNYWEGEFICKLLAVNTRSTCGDEDFSTEVQGRKGDPGSVLQLPLQSTLLRLRSLCKFWEMLIQDSDGPLFVREIYKSKIREINNSPCHRS